MNGQNNTRRPVNDQNNNRQAMTGQNNNNQNMSRQPMNRLNNNGHNNNSSAKSNAVMNAKEEVKEGKGVIKGIILNLANLFIESNTENSKLLKLQEYQSSIGIAEAALSGTKAAVKKMIKQLNENGTIEMTAVEQVATEVYMEAISENPAIPLTENQTLKAVEAAEIQLRQNEKSLTNNQSALQAQLNSGMNNNSTLLSKNRNLSLQAELNNLEGGSKAKKIIKKPTKKPAKK